MVAVGAAILFIDGCCIFGVAPSSYPAGDAAKNASRYLDASAQLLDTAIITKQPPLLASRGLPKAS
jgi:hypothetical protein